jgi:hypothetical protein
MAPEQKVNQVQDHHLQINEKVNAHAHCPRFNSPYAADPSDEG